jgi:hypothetical protein
MLAVKEPPAEMKTEPPHSSWIESAPGQQKDRVSVLGQLGHAEKEQS